eukprot:snap_masked-scaffold_3-processed-gene-5.29-mRNA-1 protein AED:0.07 eAED:0.07 QI:0/0/0/1/1/1/3/0/1064
MAFYSNNSLSTSPNTRSLGSAHSSSNSETLLFGELDFRKLERKSSSRNLKKRSTSFDDNLSTDNSIYKFEQSKENGFAQRSSSRESKTQIKHKRFSTSEKYERNIKYNNYDENGVSLNHNGRRFFRRSLNGGTEHTTGVAPVISLPRGGSIVQTKIGPIQFGIPPETIKDSLNLKLEVPRIFIVPSERFSCRIGATQGLNLAEFEFPAYFNFFMKGGKRICLVVDNESVKKCVEEVFQETLLGPKTWDDCVDFSPSYPVEKKPQMMKETLYFQDYGTTKLNVDLLLEIKVFSITGQLVLEDENNPDNTIRIERGLDEYVVYDADDNLLAIVGGEVTVPPKPSALLLDEPDILSTKVVSVFSPPAFGVTVLGSSHGFDPNGNTSGYVLWVNHRGLMIDPPPNSTRLLEKSFIPPSLIEGVVVTHCHADHDAGTFQKILQEGKVTLMTTPTIVGCFLRKYSALSGLTVDFLKTVFKFKPVKIGQPLHFHGGKLSFFYTLHSIPCVGFEVFYGEKSIVFSADHMNDPAKIRQLHEDGILTKARRDELLNFPWQHDLILHEAGVPPIHTPISTLVELPDDIKEKLYLVHVSPSSVPKESGLRIAKAGVDNTICISGVKPPPYSQELQMIDLVTGIELFSGLELKKASEVFTSAEVVEFKRGDVICKKDDTADSFYIMQSGVAEVSLEKCKSVDQFLDQSYQANEDADDYSDEKASRQELTRQRSNSYILSDYHSINEVEDLSPRRTSVPNKNFIGSDLDEGSFRQNSYYTANSLGGIGDNFVTKRFYAGDYFGEHAIINEASTYASPPAKRNATIVAVSDVSVLKFEKYGFLSILEGTGSIERLRHLASMRERGTWATIEQNSMLRLLSPSQKTQLESYFVRREFRAGDLVWSEGEPCEIAVLVHKGSLEFTKRRFTYKRRGSGIHMDADVLLGSVRRTSFSSSLNKSTESLYAGAENFGLNGSVLDTSLVIPPASQYNLKIHRSSLSFTDVGTSDLNASSVSDTQGTFKRGSFVGDVDGLRDGGKNKSGLRALTDVKLLCLSRRDLQHFFVNNPGVLLSMLHTQYIL